MDINKKICFTRGVAHLLLFQTAHGNMDVDDDYLTPDRFPLGEFVSEVRTANSEGRLNEAQKEKLRSIGFAFDKQEQAWESMYYLAKDYIKKNNGTLPDITERTSDNILIGAWIRQQVLTFRNISINKQQLLREIGITNNQQLLSSLEIGLDTGLHLPGGGAL